MWESGGATLPVGCCLAGWFMACHILWVLFHCHHIPERTFPQPPCSLGLSGLTLPTPGHRPASNLLIRLSFLLPRVQSAPQKNPASDFPAHLPEPPPSLSVSPGRRWLPGELIFCPWPRPGLPGSLFTLTSLLCQLVISLSLIPPALCSHASRGP